MRPRCQSEPYPSLHLSRTLLAGADLIDALAAIDVITDRGMAIMDRGTVIMDQDGTMDPMSMSALAATTAGGVGSCWLKALP